MACVPLDDYCLTAGDTYSPVLTVNDAAGDPATATALTIKWERRGASSPDISLTEASGQVTIASGSVTVDYATGDTSGLTPGRYEVEWVITTSGGTLTAKQTVTVEARQ